MKKKFESNNLIPTAKSLEPLNTPISPPSSAGGIASITSSIKSTAKEMGILRGCKVLFNANQINGFDCPGCAWPEDLKRSSFEFCENGVKAIAAEATNKKLTESFFKEFSLDELNKKSDMWLESQGRVTLPLIKKENSIHYEAINWDDAFDLIGSCLKKLQSPHRATFYTSGRTSNEAAFLYQLFVRLFGTNNLPDCANLCHESSGVGLKESLGIGKGSVSLDDFDIADSIFVIGQNPGTNHPRMLTSLQRASRRGCKIVSINPLKEVSLQKFQHPQEVSSFLGFSTQISYKVLQVKTNGDSALLKGIMKCLLDMEKNNPKTILDWDFINKHTNGFEEFSKSLDLYSWNEIEDISGINKKEIEEVAEIYNSSKNVIATWAMGITQHQNGVANVQDIVNLLMLKGNIGRKGSGVCPVRGHSNVQGTRTMGITENPPKEFIESLERIFDQPMPKNRGLNSVETINAMYKGDISVFMSLGGNFLMAAPDTNYTAKALQNCDLSVYITTKLNRSHITAGKVSLILPCLSRTDQDFQKDVLQSVSVEDSMSNVHTSTGVLPPASPMLKSEPEIVAKIANSVLGNKKNIDWLNIINNYDDIRSLIEEVLPLFKGYNERVRQKGGFYLSNPVNSYVFNTNTHKANFIINHLKPIKLDDNEFLMMTIRSHDQYNTTVYDTNDRYRGIKQNRMVVFMNREDIIKYGFREGEIVTLKSTYEGTLRCANGFQINGYDIPNRCVATYFPEANILIPIDLHAEKSYTPSSKSVKITIHKSM